MVNMTELKASLIEYCERIVRKMWNGDKDDPFDKWLSMEGGTNLGYAFESRIRCAFPLSESQYGMYQGRLCVYKLQCFHKEHPNCSLDEFLAYLREYITQLEIAPRIEARVIQEDAVYSYYT